MAQRITWCHSKRCSISRKSDEAALRIGAESSPVSLLRGDALLTLTSVSADPNSFCPNPDKAVFPESACEGFFVKKQPL